MKESLYFGGEMEMDLFYPGDNLTHENDGKPDTSISIKPRDKGVYIAYQFFSPLKYKLSLITTSIHRACKICSTWELLHQEIKRIMQNLLNNAYPLAEADISRSIEKLDKKSPKPTRREI